MEPPQIPYATTYKVRIVTATSLFDGHDASINIMRRILQSSGAEVIHLGHNRSVGEIVRCAIQEDAQGIAISSYQGGHMEYFTYMMELLHENGAPHIKVFGGGGGVIVQEEINALHEAGVTRIFSVEDGSAMGLQGMINFILEQCDFNPCELNPPPTSRPENALARAISGAEQGLDVTWYTERFGGSKPGNLIPVIGITGTGGAGKSSLTDELILRFTQEIPELRIAIISIDPSKVRTGGALLGDRIRMNAIDQPQVFMRSMATRASDTSISAAVKEAIELAKAAGYELLVVETSGIGQSGAEILQVADVPIYVMTQEFGAATQLEKINMLDLAEFVVLNKFEKSGSLDALRDVRKQMQRNLGLWHADPAEMPVYPTIAAQFHDEGVNRLFAALTKRLAERFGERFSQGRYTNVTPMDELHAQTIMPAKRQRYLSEIADTVREYHRWVERQAEIATKLDQVEGALAQLREGEGANAMEGTGSTAGGNRKKNTNGAALASLEALRVSLEDRLDYFPKQILARWEEYRERYSADELVTNVRDKEVRNPLFRETLSGLRIPRVALPKMQGKGDRLRFALKENIPGFYPFTAGVFALKREQEDPTRMFAGEGTPERTNKRFHYLSKGLPAARLSTAFDSVTLYGEDPAVRPDIYGKIGNSGVSICTLEDMKKLYAGFDLCAPTTSVSMTINGPAPMILAMFLNTAIDQQLEKTAAEKGLKSIQKLDTQTAEAVRAQALQVVRGTVQADILKEDQAQNTCIFSTEFAMKMMGDIQQYFTQQQVRNYYSVSISGYHIAEAGANPITQTAFTLANGFTYVEYYLARGLHIDEFAHNLSFFFSNGLDPEYAVIGRVARRIWAVAMRNRYGANERSQKLKYHIQTSGRSLHAQEVQFNDIRTTLQALMAIYDHCNSLHTNAYDEAITTPTEESVRRALAIQLIINKELGMAKNENPLQGSFLIEELTDLVEEAILAEFDRLTERGGVLGAMERMYQRSKIQEESLHYEALKHSGELPVIGVNTFLSEHEEEGKELELIRSTEEEKQAQIQNLEAFKKRHAKEAPAALERLKEVARNGENIFAELMETVCVASLGQISEALYEVGGQYRRGM